jgi:predicted phage terminase large subunit-like protein
MIPMALPPSIATLSPAKIRRAVMLKRMIELRESQEACEASLAEFLAQSWGAFDSSPFMSNWHIGAIAEHLEAVTAGQIARLLINQPPRTGKTNLIAIAWPCWTWALEPDEELPLRGAGVRFLCASYGANKAEADGVTARRLIGSEWYQARWGDRVRIARDRDNQSQYDTLEGGSRISTGIPESLGKGGAIRIVDDPTKPDEVESDLQRNATLRAYDEIWRTRSNDPVHGAEVIVMQRLHENDLSGHVLAEAGGSSIVHLMLPMEYDSRRHCHTVIGFDDPRKIEGAMLWPARFSPAWAVKTERLMGPHSWAGQMNQIPTTRGGGIIPREWWRVWPPEGQEDSWTREVDVDGAKVLRMLYPDLDFVLLSVDTAYTEKEENDWSACTVWGSFEMSGNPKIILLEAWRERLELRALTLKILDTARRRKADAVLIEAKASGLSVIQELRRLMREGEFTIFAESPKGDKVARLHAVSPAFSAGLVFAPARKWADMVMDEVSQFPRSKWKDLTDTVSAGVKKLRDLGVVQHTDEVETERLEGLTFKGNAPSIREQYGV